MAEPNQKDVTFGADGLSHNGHADQGITFAGVRFCGFLKGYDAGYSLREMSYYATELGASPAWT